MYVRGVGGGGSKSNVRVASVDLDWADMAGIRFREVCSHMMACQRAPRVLLTCAQA